MTLLATATSPRQFRNSNTFIHVFDDEVSWLLGLGRLKFNLVKPAFWSLLSWQWQRSALCPWKLGTPFFRVCWLACSQSVPCLDRLQKQSAAAVVNHLLSHHLKHHPQTPIRGDIEAAIVSENQVFKDEMLIFVCTYGSSY